jgi:hypothetical protein
VVSAIVSTPPAHSTGFASHVSSLLLGDLDPSSLPRGPMTRANPGSESATCFTSPRCLGVCSRARCSSVASPRENRTDEVGWDDGDLQPKIVPRLDGSLRCAGRPPCGRERQAPCNRRPDPTAALPAGGCRGCSPFRGPLDEVVLLAPPSFSSLSIGGGCASRGLAAHAGGRATRPLEFHRHPGKRLSTVNQYLERTSRPRRQIAGA